ncbi:hypothetical protein LINGRAHAP2_LOCUS11373 [Linum grandiflorum]
MLVRGKYNSDPNFNFNFNSPSPPIPTPSFKLSEVTKRATESRPTPLPPLLLRLEHPPLRFLPHLTTVVHPTATTNRALIRARARVKVKVDAIG